MDSLSACILAVFFFFYICFLCICAPVVYHLVVKAASIDRYSYLSGSLPQLFFLNACSPSSPRPSMLHNTDDISRHRLPPDTSTIHITNTTFYLTCYIACVLRRINTVSQSVEPTYLRHPAIRWKRLVPATARRWPWVRRGTPEHLRQRPS